MKLSSVLKLCSDLADLGLPQRYWWDQNGQEALQDKRVQQLIESCNAVNEQIACDYATDLASCAVSCKNNFIDLTNLPFNRVVTLTDVLGNNVRYRYVSGGLYAADGNYILTYAKLPPKILWDDDFTLPTPRLTERIFAFGVIADYMLMHGDYPSAKVWESKYLEGLRAATSKTPKCMPVGRWL